MSSPDRPVTYLYNTLHYYERHLRDRTNLKRKLVHAIMSSLKDNRAPGWCLSETYIKCGMNPREDNVWIPDDTYYCKLIGRLVDNILCCSLFPGTFDLSKSLSDSFLCLCPSVGMFRLMTVVSRHLRGNS